MTTSIKSLLTTNKAVLVDYPSFDGFKLELNFLPRQTLINLRKRATTTAWKKHQAVEELDDDKFLKLYTEAAIKGWTGLTGEYLARLVPVEGVAAEAVIEYSEENALILMKNSTDFDGFVSNTVNDLANFQKNSTAS